MKFDNIKLLQRALRRFKPEKDQEKDVRMFIRLADSIEKDARRQNNMMR